MTKRNLDHYHNSASRQKHVLTEKTWLIDDLYKMSADIINNPKNNTLEDVYFSLLANHFRKIIRYQDLILVHMPLDLGRYKDYMICVWYDSNSAAQHFMNLALTEHTTLAVTLAFQKRKVPNFGTLHYSLIFKGEPVSIDEVGGIDFLDFIENNISLDTSIVIEEFKKQFNLNTKKYNLLSYDEYVALIRRFSITLYRCKDNKFALSLSDKKVFFRESNSDDLVLFYPYVV